MVWRGGDCQDDERPFDRPDAAIGCRNGWIDDAVRMSVPMVMPMRVIMPVIVAMIVRDRMMMIVTREAEPLAQELEHRTLTNIW